MPEVLRCLGDAELVECSSTDEDDDLEEELARRVVMIPVVFLMCQRIEIS